MILVVSVWSREVGRGLARVWGVGCDMCVCCGFILFVCMTCL